MIRFLVDATETTLLLLSKLVKRSLADHVDLHTIADEYTFATEDGELITCLRLVGMKQLQGGVELNENCRSLTSSFSSYLQLGAHQFDVIFHRDTDDAIKHIMESQQIAFQTCDRLKLKLKSLLLSRAKRNAQYCRLEGVYLVLITNTNVFAPSERRKQKKQRIKRQVSRPTLSHAQNADVIYPDLYTSHVSYVNSAINDFNRTGMIIERIEVHEMSRSIRKMIDPDYTSDQWRASLVGDPLPMRIPSLPTNDMSDLFWPTIQDQLFPREGSHPNTKTITLGNLSFVSVYVDIMPNQEPSPIFARLANSMSPNVPFRIRFSIDSSGLSVLNIKAGLSVLLSVAGAQNRLIRDSHTHLKNQMNAGMQGVRIRISCCTWAPASNPELLDSRVDALVRALQVWGASNPTVEKGDPASGLVSSLPAVTFNNIGTSSAAPLKEVFRMLPLTRPASPFKQGSILFRTRNGSIWPYMPASRIQEVCIDLFIAKRRSGKSVMANLLNLAYVLGAGVSQLPYIRILDIGHSSLGLINLLWDALSNDIKHKVLHKRIRNTKEDSINMFDTQLGCRTPLPHEETFLINFVSLMATPVEDDKPPSLMTDLIIQVINEAYRETADKGKYYHQYGRFAKKYESGVDPLVDDAIKDLDIVIDAHTTWWEVVDSLFEHGLTREAALAQRFAVPIMDDLISVVQNSDAIKTRFSNTTVNGESLINLFTQRISTCISNYKNLSHPTQLDISNARVVALDLAEVAPKGGRPADRQTEIMYMAGRQVLIGNLLLHDDDVEHIPQAYQEYHLKRIREMSATDKRAFFDEVHRAQRSKIVMDQLDQDIREVGKRKMHMGFATQNIKDLPDNFFENATNVFILNAGDALTQRKIAEKLELSKTEADALRDHVHGPTEHGATFFLRYETKEGMQSQLLQFSPSAEELWSMSTTVDDNQLFKRLREHLGSDLARKYLSEFYPSGTARKDIEKRKLDSFSDEEIFDSITNTILNKAKSEDVCETSSF